MTRPYPSEAKLCPTFPLEEYALDSSLRLLSGMTIWAARKIVFISLPRHINISTVLSHIPYA
jgi:hypothetical protein